MTQSMAGPAMRRRTCRKIIHALFPQAAAPEGINTDGEKCEHILEFLELTCGLPRPYTHEAPWDYITRMLNMIIQEAALPWPLLEVDEVKTLVSKPGNQAYVADGGRRCWLILHALRRAGSLIVDLRARALG